MSYQKHFSHDATLTIKPASCQNWCSSQQSIIHPLTDSSMRAPTLASHALLFRYSVDHTFSFLWITLSLSHFTILSVQTCSLLSSYPLVYCWIHKSPDLERKWKMLREKRICWSHMLENSQSLLQVDLLDENVLGSHQAGWQEVGSKFYKLGTLLFFSEFLFTFQYPTSVYWYQTWK